MWLWFRTCQFQQFVTQLVDCYLGYSNKHTGINATRSRWRKVNNNSGKGLVPSGTKPILIQICIAVNTPRWVKVTSSLSRILETIHFPITPSNHMILCKSYKIGYLCLIFSYILPYMIHKIWFRIGVYDYKIYIAPQTVQMTLKDALQWLLKSQENSHLQILLYCQLGAILESFDFITWNKLISFGNLLDGRGPT